METANVNGFSSTNSFTQADGRINLKGENHSHMFFLLDSATLIDRGHTLVRQVSQYSLHMCMH